MYMHYFMAVVNIIGNKPMIYVCKIVNSLMQIVELHIFGSGVKNQLQHCFRKELAHWVNSLIFVIKFTKVHGQDGCIAHNVIMNVYLEVIIVVTY